MAMATETPDEVFSSSLNALIPYNTAQRHLADLNSAPPVDPGEFWASGCEYPTQKTAPRPDQKMDDAEEGTIYRDLNGRKCICTANNEDHMYTVDLSRDSTFARFPVTDGIYACELFRDYIKSNIPEEFFVCRQGDSWSVETLKAEFLARIQGVLWEVPPRSKAVMSQLSSVVGVTDIQLARAVSEIGASLRQGTVKYEPPKHHIQLTHH
jgi:hypothetical protein